LAKQPGKLHPLETALLGAREIAEVLGEVVILYFIDMAIAEARMKNPPTANITKLEPVINQELHERKQIYRPESGAPSRSSSGLASSML
jgi:hypothetical protein